MVSEISKLIPVVAAKHKDSKVVDTIEKAAAEKVIKVLKEIVSDKRLNIKA